MEQINIKPIQESVDTYTKELTSVVTEIIAPYCKDLDESVRKIAEAIKTGEPTDKDLEMYCLELSTKIYFLGSSCEHLGIKEDVSRAIYREVFNTRRDEVKGTVADKNAYAELYSQQELITNNCYDRAYKIIKSKLDNAQELLASCKKILSRRIQELAVTLQDVN